MNLKELKELIELVSEKGFAEFEIERQGFRLRISRFRDQTNSHVQPAVPPLVVTTPLHVPLELPAGPVIGERQLKTADRSTATEAASTEAVSHGRAEAIALHVIKSPIVGTFYRASSPTSEPFVEIGGRVGPETVVCIIEAMKLMNEIQAEVSGTVSEIYAENGQPVEYGQPLFGVKT